MLHSEHSEEVRDASEALSQRNGAERSPQFVRQGKANARTLTRAWIVLQLADGWDEAKVAETFAVTRATVKHGAHRFARSAGLT